MKSFEDWCIPDDKKCIPDELDGYEDADGFYSYPCRSCGELHQIEYDLEDFDPDMHYCGSGPHCCP